MQLNTFISSCIFFIAICSQEIQKRCEAIVKMVEKEIEDIRKKEEEEEIKEEEKLLAARNAEAEEQQNVQPNTAVLAS